MVFKTPNSIYTAHIKNVQKVVFGGSILLLVQCKADLYPNVVDTSNVEVTVSNHLESLDGKAFYNFSGISNEEVLKSKRYRVIAINFNPNTILNK